MPFPGSRSPEGDGEWEERRPFYFQKVLFPRRCFPKATQTHRPLQPSPHGGRPEGVPFEQIPPVTQRFSPEMNTRRASHSEEWVAGAPRLMGGLGGALWAQPPVSSASRGPAGPARAPGLSPGTAWRAAWAWASGERSRPGIHSLRDPERGSSVHTSPLTRDGSRDESTRTACLVSFRSSERAFRRTGSPASRHGNKGRKNRGENSRKGGAAQRTHRAPRSPEEPGVGRELPRRQGEAASARVRRAEPGYRHPSSGEAHSTLV